VTRVLLVDDDADSRDVYRRILEWTGCRVETASTGVGALRAARDRKPDVIIVDLLMPGMSGRVVADILRHSPETRSIPIIVLTGFPEWLCDRVDLEPFDAVVQKPATDDQLSRTIARVLQPSQHH